MAPLLKLPVKWGGSVNCAPETFGEAVPKTSQQGSQAACPSCGHWSYQQAGQPQPACCPNCSYSRISNDYSIFGMVTHGAHRNHQEKPAGVVLWSDVIQPYVNVSVSNRQVSQALVDCARKLNGLDPDRGMGVLHGLLAVKDDVELCKKLLELGVDPDTSFFGSLTPPDHDNPASVQPVGGQKMKPQSGSQVTEAAKQANILNDLKNGTALHFASLHGRKGSLLALIDCGVDLTAKTAFGKSAWDVAKDASIKTELDKALADGPPSLAQLARDGKYFAMRHRMRAGKVTATDMKSTCDGKTAMEFIWLAMCRWNFGMKFDEDSLAPFKIMSEMNFRYGSDPLHFGNPPLVARFAVKGGASSCKDANGEIPAEGVNMQLLSNQKAILEKLDVVSAELKKHREIAEAEREDT